MSSAADPADTAGPADQGVRPPASIIVAIRDGWDHAARCLTSVQATLGPADEVVVVDDGSRPDTARAIAQLTGVTLVRHDEARGPAAAYNAGAAAASGAYLIFLHSDTMVTPDWIDLLVAPLTEPGIVASGPCTNRGPAHQMISDPDAYHPLTAKEVWEFAATWRALNAGQRRAPRMLDAFCLAVRADAFAAIGGFDEDFGQAAGEDIDLSLRLHQAGGSLVTVDEAFVHHVGGASYLVAGLDREEMRATGFARLEGQGLLAPVHAWPTALPEPADAGSVEVSVIIPTLNRPTWLRRAVESVRSSMWHGIGPEQVEIIIVNDGGVAVRSAVADLPSDPEGDVAIRHVEQATTRGRAAALNAGLRVARGRYVATLDDDDIYLPHHLALLLTELRRQGDDAAVASLALQATEKSDGHGGTRPQRVLLEGAELNGLNIQAVSAIRAGTLLAAAADLRAIGGWDVEFGVHEDWEMHLRLARRVRLVRVDVPTVESWFRGTENRSLRQYSRMQVETLAIFDQHPTVPGDVVDESREIVRAAVRARTASYAYEASIAVTCRGDLHAAVKTLQAAGDVFGARRWEIILLVPSAAQYRQLWEQFEGDVQMISIGHESPARALQRAELLRAGRVLFTAAAGELIDASIVEEALSAMQPAVIAAGARTRAAARR
jgi:GT2 family glycosyltransferase